MVSTYPSEQNPVTAIPSELVKEVIYGRKYYYKGYKEVLNHQKKLEDVMGSSRMQSAIVTALLAYFFGLFKKQYRVMGGEAGLHLDKNDNLSLDIGIFNKADLPIQKLDHHYFEEVPVCVIEVDVKIDLTRAADQDYVFQKTQRLLDFGAEQVIWILTKSKKVMIATPNADWKVGNWNRRINILGHEFELEAFFKAEELLE